MADRNLSSSISIYSQLLCFYLVFLILVSSPLLSFSTIKSLPGFSGSFPFKLETGYVGVGEKEDVQLFYYFIESERNPTEDPLMLWLTGGPGCSAISGLAFEIGPLQFNIVEYNGSLPTLALNPYSWTKVSNIIFLDAPVGTGFSYSKSFQGSRSRDTLYAKRSYEFMRKWLLRHPKFLTNPVYIAGDSYSGMIVPVIVKEISYGNEVGEKPQINLKGYVLGNPGTDRNFDENSKIPFAHRVALISDELYESAKRSCKGEYVKVDHNNVQCVKDLQAISKCTRRVNDPHILDPKCKSLFGTLINPNSHQRYLLEENEDFFVSPGNFLHIGCRNYNSLLCNIWANDILVQNALHVRKGTVKAWIRCNKSLVYEKDVHSALSYHLYLSRRGYRALIYSGDHDMVIPYVGTLSWIKALNLSILEDWRPWLVDGQVAGYSIKYSNDFTFATVKGGGHTAPEYQPKECLAMLKRWISQQPL